MNILVDVGKVLIKVSIALPSKKLESYRSREVFFKPDKRLSVKNTYTSNLLLNVAMS